MNKIFIYNRATKQKEEEKVYGRACIEFLYGKNPLGWLCRPLVCGWPFFSKRFATKMHAPKSVKKIKSFIEEYNIDESEFLEPIDSYASFNDFFIRKLKPSARPILDGNDQATLPADGRYLVFNQLDHAEGIFVKGQKFTLEKLLGDRALSHKYAKGSMVMARLAPVDYHRFHFPCNCTPSAAKLINGPLYSVNPIALRRNIEILAENKRMITECKTEGFGTILYVEVGATNVGSIVQTYDPDHHVAKGDEKGYFSFGGSCVLLFFEPFRIQFDADLVAHSKEGIETYAKMGESLGRALG